MAKEKEILECLKKSLDDVRCIGVLTHLEEILVGEDNAGDEYHRMFTSDGEVITTIEELIGHISEDDIELDRVRVRKERFYNSLSGVRVRLNNIVVRLKGSKKGDNKLSYEFGIGDKNLVFVLSYFADNDTELPIKVNYLDLIDVRKEEEDDSNEG